MIYEKTSDALTLLDQAVVHIAGGRTRRRRRRRVVGHRHIRATRQGRAVRAKCPHSAERASARIGHRRRESERRRKADRDADAADQRAHHRVECPRWRSAVVEWSRGRAEVCRQRRSARARGHHGKRGHPAGGRERQSRAGEIVARTIDIALGPDGSAPTALNARDRVELTMPAGARDR